MKNNNALHCFVIVLRMGGRLDNRKINSHCHMTSLVADSENRDPELLL